MTLNFTFAIPVRDRRHHVVTLVNDNLVDLGVDYEIIVVEDNIGKDPILSGDLTNPACRYFRIDTGHTKWSKSILLNFALRQAQGKFFAVTDADAWFPKGLWKKIWRKISVSSRTMAFIYDNRQEGDGEKIYHWPIFNSDSLRELRGFDESMFGWGAEDDNMTHRCAISGIPVVDISLTDPTIFGFHRKGLDRKNPSLRRSRGVSSQANMRSGNFNIKQYTPRLNNQVDYGKFKVVDHWRVNAQ